MREIPPKIKKGGLLFRASALGVRINRGHVPISREIGTCPRLRSVPAAAAAEAAAAARAGTVGPGPGFVDRQGTALEVLAVQAVDGLLGLVLVRHLNEAEAAALTAELVLDDGHGLDLAEHGEGVGYGID